MRNDLHRRAQIVAATLLGDHVLIDPPGRGIIELRRVHPGEPFVVAKVQVGFRPVIGDEHLTMLVRTHRARIDVQIRVEFTQLDLEAASLQQRTKRRCGDSLAQG